MGTGVLSVLATRSPLPNAAVQQTQYYIDGSNSSGAANDGNNGNSLNSPLFTWAEFVKRVLLLGPVPQAITVTIVSSLQPTDPFYWDPILTSTGTDLIVLGNTTQIGVNFAAGVVTPLSQGNPGSDLSIATMPAGTAAGDLLFNVTRNSWAFVQSVAGATANVCQPFTGATLFAVKRSSSPTVDNTWTTGDTLQRLSIPSVTVTALTPTGGATDAAGTHGVLWLQQLRFVDPSGVVGQSSLAVKPVGCSVACVLCWVDCCLVCDGSDCGAGNNIHLNGCHCPGSVFLLGGQTTMRGGDMNRAGAGVSLWGACNMNANVIVENFLNSAGGTCFSSGVHVRAGAQLTAASGATWRISGSSGPTWGAGGIGIQAAGTVFLSANTWATSLLVASPSLGGGPNGTSYVAGVWTDGVVVNAANLDLFHGLQNPTLGARYAGG
jgi:hypothetical protein